MQYNSPGGIVVSTDATALAVPTAEDRTDLTPSQQTALEWLTAGENMNSAAAAAGVNRTTLYRWMKSDALFKAAYKTWQDEVRSVARARLTALTDAAMTTVTRAVQNGNAQIAMSVLKSQGVLNTTVEKRAKPKAALPPPAPPRKKSSVEAFFEEEMAGL